MKNNNLLKLLTLIEYIFAFSVTYTVFTLHAPLLLSGIMIIFAIFILLQALDNTDKINNIGQYNPNNKKPNYHINNEPHYNNNNMYDDDNPHLNNKPNYQDNNNDDDFNPLMDD